MPAVLQSHEFSTTFVNILLLRQPEIPFYEALDHKIGFNLL